MAKRMREKSYSVPTNQIVYISSKIFTRLADYCDALATEGNIVSLAHEGYFEITIGVENGKIVKAMVPDGPMKVLIKDDASTMRD